MNQEIQNYIARVEAFFKGVVKVAESMDEKDYDFKPTPEIFSFKELLFHIIGAEAGFTDLIKTGTWPRNKYPAENYKTKQEIIDLLKTAHKQSIATLEEISEEQLNKMIKTPWGVEMTTSMLMWGMRDHMIHHRAQLFVYIRLKGIKPPPFAE
ncbi:MAG: DinB family protein [bacterium]